MSAEPTFTGLHFFVADVQKTAAFYRAIGIPISELADGQEFVDVQLESGARFAFGAHTLTRRYDPAFVDPKDKSAVALQFYLPSREAVNELHARLTAAGHRSHLAPFDAFWGARYMEVLDPDGNVVGFHSPADGPRSSL